jgi:hypothetical protein
MKNLRIISLAFLCAAALSCGTARLADRVWSYRETHPEGFTLEINTWKEPQEGISVAYESTQNHHDRADLRRVVRHARSHSGYVGGWRNAEDSLYYFDSVRLFPEDSLEAAISFGKANHQDAIYRLSTGQEIRLVEDDESVSPTNLIIMYDAEIGKETLLQAVKDYGAELLYDYRIISGIAIKIPEGKHILEAIAYFSKVKGVTAVERDHIYHLIDPVKPKLEVM